MSFGVALTRNRPLTPNDIVSVFPGFSGLKPTVSVLSKLARRLFEGYLPLYVTCGEVLASLQEHWDGLTRFLDDPRIPRDNNASERQMRGPALGRKYYYGSGALGSGRRAALLFSLFATLTMAQLNIRTWLTWFFESCAEQGGQVPAEIDRFLPWNLPAEKRREL
ncbi:hypothetical protein BH23PLA1_BH23PLA1_04460 [soil metagenome]